MKKIILLAAAVCFAAEVYAAGNPSTLSHSLYLKSGIVPLSSTYFHGNDNYESVDSSGTAFYAEYLFLCDNFGAGFFAEYQTLFTKLNGTEESPYHRNVFRTVGMNARYSFTDMFYAGLGIGHRTLVSSEKWNGNSWSRNWLITGRLFTGIDFKISDLVILNGEIAMTSPLINEQFVSYRTAQGGDKRISGCYGSVDMAVYAGACARLYTK